MEQGFARGPQKATSQPGWAVAPTLCRLGNLSVPWYRHPQGGCHVAPSSRGAVRGEGGDLGWGQQAPRLARVPVGHRPWNGRRPWGRPVGPVAGDNQGQFQTAVPGRLPRGSVRTQATALVPR